MTDSICLSGWTETDSQIRAGRLFLSVFRLRHLVRSFSRKRTIVFSTETRQNVSESFKGSAGTSGISRRHDSMSITNDVGTWFASDALDCFREGHSAFQWPVWPHKRHDEFAIRWASPFDFPCPPLPTFPFLSISFEGFDRPKPT